MAPIRAVGAISTTKDTPNRRAVETARLLVSTSPLLTDPIRTAFVTPETNGYEVVEFRVGGLKPDTQYHYALELDGRVERSRELQTARYAGTKIHCNQCVGTAVCS